MNTLMQKNVANQTLNLRMFFLPGLLLLVMLTVFLPTNLVAEETAYNDATALGDLKQAKGVFWLSLKDVKKTAKYLQIITGTHEHFIQQDVKPDMILMFNGPMVAYLTTQPKDEIAMEYGKYLKAISKSVAIPGV